MGPQIMNNIETGQSIARLLFESCRNLFESFRKKSIPGRNEMPEDEPPPGVEDGSLDHVLSIRQTVAIDPQRDDDALWESSRKTFADAETRYVFDPGRGACEPKRVRADLSKYGVSKKPRKDRDICRTVAITFHKKWRKIPVIFWRTASGTRSPFSSV
jgi:hypothetical protein